MALRRYGSSVVSWWCSPLQSHWWRRAYSSAWNPHTGSSEDAYQVLGLPHDCTDTSIRAAFRRLAKATHPDLQPFQAASPALTAQFVRILAAYQILSDPQRRAYYDEQLRLHRHSGLHVHNTSDADEGFQGSLHNKTKDCNQKSHLTEGMEVVEWLRQYRIAVADMIHCQELGSGIGLQEELRGGLQLALRKAYFGPRLKSNQLFPDCFEADERAQSEFSDILQLVSGRYLFGAVREEHMQQKLVSDREHTLPQIMPSPLSNHKIGPAAYFPMKNLEGNFAHKDYVSHVMASEKGHKDLQVKCLPKMTTSGAYANLELTIRGKVIARASRVLLQHGHTSTSNDQIDCVSVYICPKEAENYFQEDSVNELRTEAAAQDAICHSNPSILLGKIKGLCSTESDQTCTVHGPDGRKTHIVLQHKTPFVRHIHWYKLSEDGPQCECRCRRARMPPSRFWLFEPRNASHNIGGWYIETFGRSKESEGRRSSRHSQSFKHGQGLSVFSSSEAWSGNANALWSKLEDIWTNLKSFPVLV
ncbi:hypothetical protein O6H91_09G070400 [Diphasiastrum complanatum]|uniref:Uncharacterized protein n=1 Tax=Diphasiastrum complanatum TaxID=34168 RepID=A0ACC2CQS9_DIPCM|nr:hypothetical protein O6H91_09G070400 [Diphasiastrum complanatum]